MPGPESHPDDIGLPDGPLHFVSADRAVPQFTADDLRTFAQCIDVTLAAGLLRDSLKPITQEHLEELKTRTLSLAFMEVSRDA